MSDLVHIGWWSGHILRPLCGDDSPSVAMASDKEPGVFLADCPDCITEMARNACSLCDGTGWLKTVCECCGPEVCAGCYDGEAWFEQRKKAYGWPAPPPHQEAE